jgi:UDP-N-acetylmuramate dehydrogenase
LKSLQKIPSEIIKGNKIPVGYLIEQCNLKGKRIGDAQISPLHANFIVNLGKATAKEVYQLIELCKHKCFRKI